MTAFGALLLLLATALYAWVVALMGSINEGDPAGRAMGQGFAFLGTIALWVVLAVLLLIAGVKGEMPGWAKIAALVLLPASGAAALAALSLITDRTNSLQWPIVIVIAAPPMIAAYAVWAYVPYLRASIDPNVVGGGVWGVILILAIAPWPATLRRGREADVRNQQAAAVYGAQEAARLEQVRRDNLARLQELPPDAPLWKWMELTAEEKQVRPEALDAIRRLSARQSQAEEMLAQGLPWPLVEAPNLGLEATPPLCESARKLLDQEAPGFAPPKDSGRPYSWEQKRIEQYLPALDWLTANHCDCSAQIAAIERSVRMFPACAERDACLARLARFDVKR